MVACPSLTLTPPWSAEPLVLVCTPDALRLCRQGSHRALPSQRALDLLRVLGRGDMGPARAFAARCGLGLPPLARCEDALLRKLLVALVAAGALTVVRQCEQADEDESGSRAKQRRVVREIETRVGRLRLAGREYRLVTDTGLQRLSDRDGYEVVRRQDAVQVLHGVAQSTGPISPDLTRLFDEAIALLTPDWRPPLFPDGLILLRRIPRIGSARGPEVPVLTPSQLQQLREPVDFAYDEEAELDDLLMAVDVEDLDMDESVEVEGDGGDDGDDAADADATDEAAPPP